MKKFEECKSEWLQYAQEEKMLKTKIWEKVKMVLDQQKEIGKHFPFPRYENFEEVKRHHWFFHKIESYSTLECPCCKSPKLLDYYFKFECDYLDVYECPICNYFSIDRHITFPNCTIHSYLSSLQSLRIFNSQLDKHLKNEH